MISPDMFGLPNEGVHAIRLFDYAIVDIVLTIIVAYVTAIYFKTSVIKSVIAWFVFAQICHIAVGVRTKFVRTFLE
jgi:hypothetical protein